MSTLVDFQIKSRAEYGMITPYSPEQVNPASYDVLLGDVILIESGFTSLNRWKEVSLASQPYMLPPGGFVLASTVERICLPDNIEAVFCLKSSRGREGFNHALSAYIDPSFNGEITLELYNCSQFYFLELSKGMRIGQLRFAFVSARPLIGYDKTGHYNGQRGPTPSLFE